MNQFNNTFESLVFLLTQLVQPLESRLNQKAFRPFFAELGLVLPPSVETDANIAAKLKETIKKVQELTGVTEELVKAIADKDKSKIVSEGKKAFNLLKPIFENIKTVANALKAIGGGLGSIPASEVNTFADKLPQRIFEWLVVTQLERINGLAEGLEFVGAVARIEKSGTHFDPAGTLSYTEKSLDINALFSFLSTPEERLRNLYRWGEANFDGIDMLRALESVVLKAGAPATFDETMNVLDIGVIELETLSSTSPTGLSTIFRDRFPIDKNLTISEDEWKLKLGLDLNIEPGLQVNYFSNGDLQLLPPTGSVEGESSVEWTGKRDDGYIIFGTPDSSRLSIDEVVAKVSSNFRVATGNNGSSADLDVSAALNGGKLVIDTSSADNFISSLMGEGVDAEFQLVAGWNSETGLYFRGSSALELDVPVHIDLGPVEIQIVHIGVGISSEGLPVTLGITAKGELGPFAASVQNIGIRSTFSYVGEGGTFGPIDADFGFKPPEGIGLSVDASIIKGGGFLSIDHEKGEYSGVAELSINGLVTVKAIGIINTRLPGDQDGFALLLLITAEFSPVQLGFGFTLNGVGGLIGANRGMNLLVIRDGVRNNTLDHILFPDDPVANAPQIIASLNGAFPLAVNNHTFGVMGIIGWGTPTLLEIELGLMITFPSFDLAILGKLSASLPDKSVPLLTLNVAFIGSMSFERKYFYFDAQIFDSKLLSISLSGSMAVRILWGDQPNFVLTVGGFHPDFTPPPLELNNLQRITLNLLADDNPRLTLQCYFAVTSNTVQFGAMLDFLFKVSKFKVVGYFHFHALFQFDPFYFNVYLGAGLAVKLGSSTILSVSVSGSLEGPTPWKAIGTGKFKILWISFSVSFSVTWGETRNTSLPLKDILPGLRLALEDNRNWQSLMDLNALQVTLRDTDNSDEGEITELLLHPFGSLSVNQRVVPLEIEINLFGSQTPKDYKRFSLEFEIENNTLDTVDIRDHFSPAHFFELSDAEKISKKSYELYKSGITAKGTNALHTSARTQKRVEYETTIMDEREQPRSIGKISEHLTQFNHWKKNNAIARSKFGTEQTIKKLQGNRKVEILQENFVIAHVNDLSAVDTVVIGSEFEAQASLQKILLDNPEMEGELMVIPEYEAA